MSSERAASHGEPDLAEEARFWREWNAAVYARSENASLATRAIPDRSRMPASVSNLGVPEQVTEAQLIEVHAAAGRFFQACLRGSWVPDYLNSRSLAAALLLTSPWKIGYAPATWTALTDHLRRIGYPNAVLLSSGLVITGRDGHLHDRFRDRLMVPLRRETGAVIAFIGRRHPDHGDEEGPKYLNSPDTDLFIKGHILAGLAEGRRPLVNGARPVLVEGPMDAIAVSLADPARYIGIAPCGTSLTPEQVAALASVVDLRESGLHVALDGDNAGRTAAIRAYSLLQSVVATVTAVVLPDGRDPADILASDGRDVLRDTLTTSIRPLADLVVDARIEEWGNGRELDIERQIGALRAAAKVIATMPASEVGPQATRLCEIFASRYDWSYGEVTREIIDAVERHLQTAPAAQLPDAATRVISRATAPAQVPAARKHQDKTFHRARDPRDQAERA